MIRRVTCHAFVAMASCFIKNLDHYCSCVVYYIATSYFASLHLIISLSLTLSLSLSVLVSEIPHSCNIVYTTMEFEVIRCDKSGNKN